MSKYNLEKQVEQYGSLENYKEYLSSGFANEQAVADVLKWYGSKEKAMEAVLQSTGRNESRNRMRTKGYIKSLCQQKNLVIWKGNEMP